MADDLDKKLQQIAEMFGVSDTSQLKNIVNNIMPNEASQSKAPLEEPPPAKEVNSNYSPQGQDFNSNLGIMAKAGEMMGMFNNISDSRITLLNSVQPFLGPQRQERLGGAIQLLKVINVLSTISPGINRTTKG